MATNLPTPESYEQLLSDMLSAYASKLGINDFNVGSAVTSFFETVALSTARASGDVFQILRDFSVDRATGEALKRLAAENRVKPVSAAPATGLISVIDTSFSKISSKVYAGANPPNIGSTTVNVSDASLFPQTGKIYIGRGTNNVEGPIPYSSITSSGGFFTITLTSPTAKFHNLGESVILAQGGNRSVAINTTAISPALGASPDLQYSVSSAAVILDGETRVDNVPVSAQNPGIASNVPAGAIRAFASPPFAGATVTNPLPFTNGSDTETDDQLRARIKRALSSTGLGTATAVRSSVIGATPSDESATIVSASILSTSDGATLFIDSGNGYEAKTAGVGVEGLVDYAIGGEQFFQLATGGRQAPVAKAFLQSTNSAPFDLVGGDALSLVVGGQTYQHVFQTTDFRSPGGVTAFEVTASVNGNTALGFEATTAGGGSYVIFRAKKEGSDSIQSAVPTASGRDASVQMGLPSNQIQTLRLYKNNSPLSKDGNTAALSSQPQQLWSTTIANGETLVLSVDGTSPITFTILDTDFIATGLYTSVSSTNTLSSWAQVLNTKLTGVTVQVVGQQLQIVSNLGASNRAKLAIDASSTLVSKGMFSIQSGLVSQGAASDFTLDRNTAQIQLATPLVKGDIFAAGSTQTEAQIQSAQIPGGSLTLSSDGHLWLMIDSDSSIVTNGVAANTTISVSKPSQNVVQYASSVSTAFTGVNIGDYLIVWSAELDASQRLEARVSAVTATTLQIVVTPAEWSSVVPTTDTVISEGFVTLRSAYSPQKFRVQAGTSTLDQIASQLQTQTSSLKFSVLSGQYLIIKSRTKDQSGAIQLVAADYQGKLLGIVPGTKSNSKTSLIAYYDSDGRDVTLPLFVHAMFASGSAANPVDSYISSVTSSLNLSSRDPNELISLLQPYGPVPDAQAFSEYVQETSINGSTIGIAKQSLLRRVRAADRFFVASPLDFGYQDSAVVVLDADTTNKSFQIPLYRRAIANSTNPSNANSFNAYDADSGASANFTSAFGSSFDFSNFKVLMQAKKTLKTSVDKTAILYRAKTWGRSGEKITVGYTYPSVPNSPVNSIVTVNSKVSILINLKSGAPVASTIDGSTHWNVTITPKTPAGTDQVTYTYSGTGSAPGLNLSGGEYVNLTSKSEFNSANLGVFRVSTQAGFSPTSNSFTVTMPAGVAVTQSNAATLVPNAISFYRASDTLASDIQAYVAANLSRFISATLVLDTDASGSGIVPLSTYEDSGFTTSTVTLQDGINWIQSSNISGSVQFSLKKPLNLPTDVGYAFNAGEEVRLIPTTTDQVSRLLNVLAVSGFTTVGTVGAVVRGTRLELATSVVGSQGALQIVGGSANQYSVPVLDSASRVDNLNMLVSVDYVSGAPILSDQWFKLQASQKQTKDSFIGSNTSVTILGQNPGTGQSTINLLNRSITQRYFGRPRHMVRSRGTTFRVERQGSLVCISSTGVGSSPQFLKTSLNFNDASGGTLNVYKATGSNDAIYQILTGAANFTELSIGDILSVQGMALAGNNGSFLVTGVSDDGTLVQVANPNVANQLSSGTFTFSANSTAGDSFTVGSNTLVAGTSFAIGTTAAATAQNLASFIGTLSGVAGSSSGNVVTVTATSPAANIALAYSGTPVVATSGSTLAGSAFAQGNFSAQSGVSEGDTVIIGAPFSVLNQGKFRVIRRFGDSIWIENPNVVTEEVSLPTNSIGISFDATTGFKVNATGNKLYLNWTGIGTEPHLENSQMGDTLILGNDFAVANRGAYMVTRSGAKQQEIAQIVVPSGLQFSTSGAGTYFKINNAGNLNQYYVWFNINSGNTDPAPVGLTGVQVAILSSDSASQVATKLANAITASTTGLTSVASSATVTVTTVGFIETTDPVNVNVPAPFSVTVLQSGRRTFVECLHPSAVNQSSVMVSTDVLLCNRPQISFYEYEATVPGDQIVINGSALGSSNAGTYTVVQALSRESVVVSANLAPATNVSLNNISSAISVQEGVAYSGYKHVLLTSSQPSSPARISVVLDSTNQYSKINQAAGIQMTSLNKLNFTTAVRKGLDSYNYNTGLIAEANRIIYGDTRDPITYPGVAAAGATIFVREPLTLRVRVSVDVRLLTGAPFSVVAQQIRSTVAALINSNPVGQSIDIASIVAAVRSVGGVQSVSIDSPLYDATHDLIALTPGQKARIIDPSTDISVIGIGV